MGAIENFYVFAFWLWKFVLCMAPQICVVFCVWGYVFLEFWVLLLVSEHTKLCRCFWAEDMLCLGRRHVVSVPKALNYVGVSGLGLCFFGVWGIASGIGAH